MKTFDVSDLESLEVRELRKRIDELLSMFEEGETVELTKHGKFFARVRPEKEKKPSREQEIKAFWADIDQLALQIGAKWKDNMSAVDAVRDVRRDL